MAYIWKHMLDGEEVQVGGRCHPGLFLVPLGRWVFFLVTGLVAAALTLHWSGQENFLAIPAGLVALACGFLVLVGLFLVPAHFLDYLTTEFALTNRRVILKLGLLNSSLHELSLDKVERLDIEQSGIASRLMNFGDIRVVGIGTSRFFIPCVPDAFRFRKETLSRVDKSAQRVVVLNQPEPTDERQDPRG